MKRESAWKEKSAGANIRWDFVVPAHMNKERMAEECARVLDELVAVDTDAEPGSWLALAHALPPPLRAALVRELQAGNRIARIERATWPSQGSIVVFMEERFHKANRGASAEVSWSAHNYPHSWREDMSQRVGGIDYVLMT